LNLGLIQSWGFTDGKSWNSLSWAVSAEWFACLMTFPLAMGVLKKIESRVALALAIALTAGGYTLLCPTPELGGLQPLIQVTAEFFAGCCLCRLRDLWKNSEVAATRLVNTSVVLIAALTWFSNPGRINPGLILLFAGLILGLSRSRGTVTAVLGSRWAVYLGETSYALYMTHALFQKAVNTVVPPEWSQSAALGMRCGIVALYLLTMLTIASIVHHAIEVPARGWIRRMARQRAKLVSAAATSL
jgi:peptidoglycan/LPS O-acetylase OafA/YrhL